MSSPKRPKGAQGAKGAQISSSKPLARSYLGNHRKAFQLTLNEQKARPFSAFFTSSVIGIAILLPTLLGILLLNISQADLDLDSSSQITLMLDKNVSALDAAELGKKLEQRTDILVARFIEKDEALKEFKQAFNLDATLAHLDENPLPNSIVLTPAAQLGELSAAQALKAELEKLPEVELVQLDLMWVQRLRAIGDFLERSTWLVALMLSIAVLLILGNTVRLAIENRKEEIAVLKLVGGTDAFVCRPFLYLGAFYGFAGGVLAIIFSSITLAILSGPVESLANSYQSGFSLSGLNLESTLLILAIGTLLGWLGSWLAVRRHIREIEPN